MSLQKLIDSFILENTDASKEILRTVILSRTPKSIQFNKRMNESVDSDFDKLWDKYVPKQGNADTSFGEAVRAVGRFEYEANNNGFQNAYESGYADKLDPFYAKLLHKLDREVGSEGDKYINILRNATSRDFEIRRSDPTRTGSRAKKFNEAIKWLKEYLVKHAPEEKMNESSGTGNFNEKDKVRYVGNREDIFKSGFPRHIPFIKVGDLWYMVDKETAKELDKAGFKTTPEFGSRLKK